MILEAIVFLLACFSVAYWIFSISSYDWTKFEEDREKAKRDLF